MSSSPALKPEADPILACTVARDVQKFDLLIEDMENELGEAWGDLSFQDARLFFTQPEAQHLQFVAIAIDEEDEVNLAMIADLIDTANANDLKVILIAEEVSPIALHQLLRLGAKEFAPYPLPEGALHDAVERLRKADAVPEFDPKTAESAAPKTGGGSRDGVIVTIHGLAGGVGATTMAVNLAWELANLDKKNPPKVCLLDLDLQFGSVATFLDLPRREAVYELLSDTESMDNDSFMQSLVSFNDKISVLTAPSEILPLDILGPDDIERLLSIASSNFDYIVVDMPTTIVQWTEAVLSQSHVYLAPLELDMRSAQNTLRMVRGLKSEDLPFEKLRYVMNRAPKFTDLSGKSRVKRMAESLDIEIELMMPDGGKQIVQSCDHGLPLSETAAKNPLRRELQKLASSIHKHNLETAAAQ
ncbi:Type II/IV secretion system ATPase TadZ/CpaE [Candidatus Rhodobacter oscarellae]|uniref:Type II/IV secretion system ATPase TadZ/CpaE n=1 Tax=Candidatus Rhodobacter oscarellae TaxID=1675527 RepID=A0A0J9E9Q9_9RHOB|nr:AAA family ATPase [Candidatus Rhodobacter lobularis]KMW59520.1 Type II/IV secretion system ATPase TadZ/CpaE [Candidatus Rhodobacter lobularis]